MKQMLSILICVLLSVSLRTSVVSAADPGFASAATDEELFNCDFESDLCGMQLVASPVTQFTWVRFSGPTPSKDTGPDFDHTSNSPTGYYMYTEATDHQPGEVTSLTISSGSLTPSTSGSWSDACLTFWQNMYGQHIGTLNVTVGQNDVQWSLSYNQSYGWFQQNVTLKNFINSNPAQTVSFIGVRGGNEIGQPFGDIAIDDVIIYAGPCGFDVTTEAPTTTAATTSTTVTTTTTATTIVPTTTADPMTTAIDLTTTTANIVTTEASVTQGATTTRNTLVTDATTSDTMTTETPDMVTTAGETGTVTSSNTSYSSEGSTEFTGSTPRSEGQVGASSDNTIWSLNERDMIILLAFLCAAILFLIIIVIVLACYLCIARRKYIVERTANMYPSSSTIDRVSTVETQHPAPRSVQDRSGYVSPYEKSTDHHF